MLIDIKAFFESMKNGFRWFKRGYKLKAYDFEYLFDVMEYQLQDMKKNFIENNCCEHDDEHAEEIQECLNILKKIKYDDEDNIYYLKHEVEKLFMSIERNILSWWN